MVTAAVLRPFVLRPSAPLVLPALTKVYASKFEEIFQVEKCAFKNKLWPCDRSLKIFFVSERLFFLRHRRVFALGGRVCRGPALPQHARHL